MPTASPMAAIAKLSEGLIAMLQNCVLHFENINTLSFSG